MINKLLEAVIKKHGEIEIFWNSTSRGNFHIVLVEGLPELCFDIELGLINILSRDKKERTK